MEYHTIKPYYNKDSKILILGSFPSQTSREKGFYYAYPQNRFWKVLENIFHEKIENNITAKKEFLKKHHIALFDVCASCDIHASSDASIKNVVPNDLSKIIKDIPIKAIFINGTTAYKLYQKYHKDIAIEAICLPSTSPANAKYRIEALNAAYSIILKYIK